MTRKAKNIVPDVTPGTEETEPATAAAQDTPAILPAEPPVQKPQSAAKPTELSKKIQPEVREPLKEETKIPRGHVQVIALDKDGNEKPGTEFIISEKGFNRQYAYSPLFKIKKKANN